VNRGMVTGNIPRTSEEMIPSVRRIDQNRMLEYNQNPLPDKRNTRNRSAGDSIRRIANARFAKKIPIRPKKKNLPNAISKGE